MARIDAIREVRVTEQTYYRWRKQYGGMGTDQLKELKRPQKGNERLRQTAFRDPKSFFHRYSELSEDAAQGLAEGLWANINLKNLKANIQPTRPRADLILKKGSNHLVEEVLLRKL
jgi:hypothetical protein